MSGVLKRDAIVPIHCVIPEATEVKLQVDSKWVDTESYEEPILQTKTKVGSTDIIVYAKYGSGKNYDGLIKYSVQ